MVSNPTQSIDATKTRTRIYTLLIFAGQLRGTVIVENALRFAIWRRANHSRLASAVTPLSVASRRVSIRATRVGVAGVFFYNWFNS